MSAETFCEGNTRATAVFMIKYMKTFGFKVNNDAFEKNSWYFRNALVRANYNDLQNGIHATTKFLEMFFSNLILGTEYELKNRYMHVDYVDDNFQSVIPKVPKSQFDTLECTLEELAVLKLIYKNPSIKQKELVAETGKSLSTVKRIMESLQKKDYIEKYKAQGRQMNLRAYGVPQNKTKSKKKDAKETVPNGNYLWINQFATALNDTGRAALVMANSASDAGNSEKDIRIKLIELWGMNIRTDVEAKKNFMQQTVK